MKRQYSLQLRPRWHHCRPDDARQKKPGRKPHLECVFVCIIVFGGDESLFNDQATKTVSNEYDGCCIRSLRLLAQQGINSGRDWLTHLGRLCFSSARKAIQQIVRMLLNPVAAHIPSDLRVVRKYEDPGRWYALWKLCRPEVSLFVGPR